MCRLASSPIRSWCGAPASGTCSLKFLIKRPTGARLAWRPVATDLVGRTSRSCSLSLFTFRIRTSLNGRASTTCFPKLWGRRPCACTGRKLFRPAGRVLRRWSKEAAPILPSFAATISGGCLPARPLINTTRCGFISRMNFFGPWREHPANPIVSGNKHNARPAGRVLTFDGKLIRFSQDCVPAYGTQVRAFEILELTTTSYVEEEVQCSPVLVASGVGWNAAGMHHVDAHLCEDGSWIACVDGRAVIS